MAVALHDVDNTEAFCARVLGAYLDQTGGYLTAAMREDLLATMLLLAVETAEAFRPGQVSFERFLSYRLTQRMPDFYRRELGDSRTARRRPPSVPLDALMAEADGLPAALVVPSPEDEILSRVALEAA